MMKLIYSLLAILALAFALPIILPIHYVSEAPCRMGCAAHLRQIAMACDCTSYEYLGPDGETDATLGEVIVVREKVHHPAYPATEPWPAGHHVITGGLRVEFVPDAAGQAREPDAGVAPATRP